MALEPAGYLILGEYKNKLDSGRQRNRGILLIFQVQQSANIITKNTSISVNVYARNQTEAGTSNPIKTIVYCHSRPPNTADYRGSRDRPGKCPAREAPGGNHPPLNPPDPPENPQKRKGGVPPGLYLSTAPLQLRALSPAAHSRYNPSAADNTRGARSQ